LLVRTMTTSSPDETESIAGRLAGQLAPGDIVTVSGELGSGKTTFVRGAARALGVTDPVTSPTYTIGNRYRGSVVVSHLDLYRFEQLTSPEWGDVEPYFDEAVVFVEWPEAGTAVLPPARAGVELRHVTDNRRALRITSNDAALLDAIASG
jgi:tRNA threonylcarbamoyladenosine biosynthesis protein TsaE